jgi:integrase
MMRRVIKQMPDKTERKHPVGAKDLLRIHAALPQSVGAHQLTETWCWWLLSYGAMLRCCETQGLLWSGIRFEWPTTVSIVPVGMRVTLVVSNEVTFKTHTNSVEFHFVSQSSHPGMCPVFQMWKWYGLSGERGWPNGDKVFGLSSDQSRKLFQKTAAAVLKMNPVAFGLHSLRAGAATDCEELGYTLSQIQFQGRWRSATMLVYLRNGHRMAQEIGVRAPRGLSARPTMFSQQHQGLLT